MLEFDAPFRAKARALRAPNSQNFDLTTWRTLSEARNLSSSDLGLGATAVWIADQAAQFRHYVSRSEVPQLDARTSTLFAVAILNREQAVISEKQARAKALRRQRAVRCRWISSPMCPLSP